MAYGCGFHTEAAAQAAAERSTREGYKVTRRWEDQDFMDELAADALIDLDKSGRWILEIDPGCWPPDHEDDDAWIDWVGAHSLGHKFVELVAKRFDGVDHGC